MKTFLLTLFAFIVLNSTANTYYFSSDDGDDSRSSIIAQNPLTPWKTLDKFNSISGSLLPGDVVLFKRGNLFYGSLTISKSGTPSAPIIIGAYGIGAKPIITGFQSITNWNAIGGGIFEKSMGQENVNLVTFQDTLQPMGRWPKTTAPGGGYLVLDSHSGTSSITSSVISSAPQFIGGEIVTRPYGWILGRARVTNQTSNVISYAPFTSPGHPGYTYEPQNGFGFFFQNHINALSQTGDWMYDANTKKLRMYFGSQNPANYNIKAATIENLVIINSLNNITFDGLSIKGANSNAFNINKSNNIYINNCDIDLSGTDGIFVSIFVSKNITVKNCSITNSNNNAITANGSTNWTIQNNIIRNTGLNRGMGLSGDGQYIALSRPGSKSLVEYNEIKNTGYIGVDFQGDSVVIKNNYIDSFCMVKSDGGGIYTSAKREKKAEKL